MAYADQRRLAERHDPVFVPKHLEERIVHTRLEVRDVERIVARRMDTEVFDLVKRDRLIVTCLCVGRCVILE